MTGQFYEQDFGDQSAIVDLLESTLSYSRYREYRGYDYSDGLSSKILRTLPVDHKWINIAFQESAKRAPINIRPLLLIPKRRSYKGTGIFVLANLAAYEFTQKEMYLDEAEKLIEWLINKGRDDPFGWGHNHDIQMLNSKVTRNTPSIVTTTYVTMALLQFENYRETPIYDVLNDRVSDLIFETLDYTECDTGARITYRKSNNDHYILNSNALGARLLLELYREFGDRLLRDRAEAILDYVVSQQTELGGWMYTDPPSASHLSMDNHHNGFIIESLLRHRSITGSETYSRTIERSLNFYKEVLHTDAGAPRWDEQNEYPRDIHAAAQGIITFSRAGDIGFAKKILQWTLENLYAGSGQFYYRKQRFYTKRFTLMRWCQAWMAYALSTYLNGHTEPIRADGGE